MNKLFLLFILIVVSFQINAATYTSSQSGNWDRKQTWGNTAVPGAGDIVIVSAGNSVTVNAAASCSLLTINSTGTVSYSGAFALTVSTTATITGTLTMNIAGCSAVFNNITISSGGIWNATAAGAITISGNFSKIGTFSIDGSSVTIAGTATQSIAGFTTTGLVSMTKTAGTATFQGNVNGGGLTINGSGGTLDLGSGMTHTFTGAWTRTAGTIIANSSTLKIGGTVSGTGGTFTYGTGTVEYNGTVAQTIANINYNNLTFSGAHTTNSITINGAVGVAGTLTNSASFTGAGNFVLTGSTITFNGSGSQTIPSLNGTSYASLVLSNGGTKTLGASNAVATAFNVGTGVTFDPSSYVLSAAGTFTVNGTALVPGATFAANYTIAGTKTLNTGSTIHYTGADQTVSSALSYHHLSLSGSGKKTADGNLTVGGNLNNTVTMDLVTHTLNVTGTTTNCTGTHRFSGTNNGMAISTGTVEYYGASQTVAAGTYKNLIINQSTGNSTLGGAALVTGELTLTKGHVITDLIKLLTIGAYASISGASSASFIHGPVAISADPANVPITLLAPIGKGTEYRPIWSHIYSLTGTGTLTAEQIESPALGPVTATGTPVLSGKRYFKVVAAGLTGGIVDLTLSWDSDDGVIDPTSVTVVGAFDDGGIWSWAWANNGGGYTGDASAGTVTTSSFNPSGYALGVCAIGSLSGDPLPVNLSSFTAVPSNGVIKLSWKTTVETNNHGFDVEHSTDNLAWSKLTFIQGQGNSNTAKEYSYCDKTINKAGKNYYRLKQIDNNGGYKYSKVVEVNSTLPTDYSLSQNYPNPFNPSTKINYSLPADSKVTIDVYNVAGVRVCRLISQEQAAGYYSVDFSNSSVKGNLSSGVYIYRINAIDKVSGKEFSSVKKMVLLK